MSLNDEHENFLGIGGAHSPQEGTPEPKQGIRHWISQQLSNFFSKSSSPKKAGLNGRCTLEILANSESGTGLHELVDGIPAQLSSLALAALVTSSGVNNQTHETKTSVPTTPTGEIDHSHMWQRSP